MSPGRPAKDMDLYKAEILHQLHVQKWKQQEVVAWLADNKNLIIHARTLRRNLHKWETPLLQDNTKDTEDLRNRIRVLFCKNRASDKEMVMWLRAEGFRVSPRGLVRIRRELGLRRSEL